MCPDPVTPPAEQAVPAEQAPSRDVASVRSRVLALPRRIFYVFVAADLGLFVTYTTMVLIGLGRSKAIHFVDLNGEGVPPSWYSASLLLVAALSFGVLLTAAFEDVDSVREVRGLFALLFAGFLFLSADEGGVIHERISMLLARVGFTASIHGGGTAILFYILVALVVALLARKQLVAGWRLWRSEMLVALGGLALAFFGGVVVEIAGYFVPTAGNMKFVFIGIEETLETLGWTLIAFAAMTVLAKAFAQRYLPEP